MTPLISLTNITLAYGAQPFFENANLHVFQGERICLIGRNGAGKSSLLRLIAGSEQPDTGLVWVAPHVTIGVLPQTLPDSKSSVFDYVASGLEEVGKLLQAHHRISLQLAEGDATPSQLAELARCQAALDAANGWHLEARIKQMLQRLSQDGDVCLSALSGGWKRRAALARAMVSEPSVLLLDEPTNHLDLSAITWLEECVQSFRGAVVFVTHDRTFLERLATRIVEIDRGKLDSWDVTYSEYLKQKTALLANEAREAALFDKKLAEEEVWIRQGIKARRTRNEGRVRALLALREERKARIAPKGTVKFTVNAAENSGKIVFEAEYVNYAFAGKTLIKDFSARVMRLDRIGLIGDNGVGKSTLLKLLLGNLQPNSGTVTRGTNLKVAYFDQMRAGLDLEKTCVENISQGSDFIDFGERRCHIMTYLSEFLFARERARTPVKALSGGECHRLLLAKLFSLPSNVLVMDEPTNDLDIETLELLEELLLQYEGTILLVSHDRAFLDHVVTSTWVFEGNGVIQEYVGGYEDYLRQRSSLLKNNAEGKIATPLKAQPEEGVSKPKSTKLSYKEQREWDALPGLIESLEKEQADLQLLTQSDSFYKQNAKTVSETMQRLQAVAKEIENAYERFEYFLSR